MDVIHLEATHTGKAVQALAGILLDEHGRIFITNLEYGDAELSTMFLAMLEYGIKGPNLATAEKRAFFATLIATLRRLAQNHQALPESMMIAENVEVGDEVLASRSYADTRVGSYMGNPVAVKTYRVNGSSDLTRLRSSFYGQVILWSKLSHPNVLKLVGVHGDMQMGPFSAVSELMAKNIMEYIKEKPVNRLELLHGAAQGLEYLHNLGIAHGRIEGTTILVSNDTPPRACLADFDYSSMVLDPLPPAPCGGEPEGCMQVFMSPELLRPVSETGNQVSAMEADIYAFGLAILQVLTGKPPFPTARIPELVFSVINGYRPEKPADASAIGFSEPLWGLTRRCWNLETHSRPEVTEVVTYLAEAAANWHELMPPCNTSERVGSISEVSTFDSVEECSLLLFPNFLSRSPTLSTISTDLPDEDYGLRRSSNPSSTELSDNTFWSSTSTLSPKLCTHKQGASYVSLVDPAIEQNGRLLPRCSVTNFSKLRLTSLVRKETLTSSPSQSSSNLVRKEPDPRTHHR